MIIAILDSSDSFFGSNDIEEVALIVFISALAEGFAFMSD